MKKLLIIPVILLLLFSIAGCQKDTPANPEGKSIVVTYSVLGSVVKDLVGDKATVTVSVPNGQDPHDWQPSAKDIEAVNKADLVVQNGLGLEGGLEKTLANAESKGVKFFTATDYITVRHVGPGEGIPSGDPDQALGAADPHMWLDPVSMKNVVIALADKLEKDLGLDVSARAQDLENRLDALNKQIESTVSVIPEENRKLVTGHESMGYFAQRYAFKLTGVIVPSLSSQAEVSTGDLADLEKTIRDNGIKAIFTELGTSPAVAKKIGEDTGAKVIELPTHTLPEDGSYFTFMNDLTGMIGEGLK